MVLILDDLEVYFLFWVMEILLLLGVGDLLWQMDEVKDFYLELVLGGCGVTVKLIYFYGFAPYSTTFIYLSKPFLM